MRASVTSNNFTSGEVTPLLFGRPELAAVQTGLQLCQNMKVLPHGGVTRREGTRYVGAVKNSTENSRLIPFVFGNDEAYIMEVGKQYIRFWTEAGQVLGGTEEVVNGTFDSGITSWTDASTGSGTVTWDAARQSMKLTDLIAIPAGTTAVARQTLTGLTTSVLHNASFEITIQAGSTCVMSIGSTLGGTEYHVGYYGSGTHTLSFTPTGATVYLQFSSFLQDTILVDSVSVKQASNILELVTPYEESEIDEVMYAQSNDVMWMCHRNHVPRQVTRTGVNAFSIQEASIQQGPFMPVNASATTMTLAAGSYAKGDSGTLTASTSYFVSASDVGQYMLLYDPADLTETVVVVIDSYSSGTVVNVTFQQAVPAGLQATASAIWAEQAIGPRHGYPSAVTLHDQRLVYGGTTSRPQNIYGSTIGDFDLFSFGTDADDHYNFNLSTNQQSDINALVSKYNLIAMSNSVEWNIMGGGLDSPITPSEVTARPQTSKGSKRFQPESVDDVVAFVQRAGRKVMMIDYDPQSRKLGTFDATLLSEHLTSEYTISQISYQAEHDKILWSIRSDGVLLGLTYDKAQEVSAWHWHDTASGLFKSVATIPKSSYDQTWAIVERTINGVTTKMIEYFVSQDWRIDDNPYYVDSGVTFGGTATNTISGLDHLEGESVQVYSSGEYLGEFTVSSGSITLDREVTQAHIGLGYTSKMQEVPDVTGSQDGSSEGRKKGAQKISLRLYRTQAIKVNGDIKGLPREASATKPELFTGVMSASKLGWDYEAANTIESVGANPLTVLSINKRLNVGQD